KCIRWEKLERGTPLTPTLSQRERGLQRQVRLNLERLVREADGEGGSGQERLPYPAIIGRQAHIEVSLVGKARQGSAQRGVVGQGFPGRAGANSRQSFHELAGGDICHGVLDDEPEGRRSRCSLSEPSDSAASLLRFIHSVHSKAVSSNRLQCRSKPS